MVKYQQTYNLHGYSGGTGMKKKAIIFSAAEYIDSKTYPKPTIDLPGVYHDVVAIEKRFKQIGFDTIKNENALKDDYFSLLENETLISPNDAIYCVYFSGHGGHCNGKNYIYPSDFAIRYDKSNNIEDAAINLEDIISIFKNKGRLILILDSCRADFGTSKGYYSEMTSAENVYIAYGTMFNKASISLNNGVSYFTEAICDEILKPNIDVDTLFTQVRQNIYTKYSVQIPSSVNTLLDNIILNPQLQFDDSDKEVYDFIQKYGDEYTDKYGYFQGDDLIFIDAAQYFNISFLDAVWKFKKVDNKIFKDRSTNPRELTEDECKVVTFLGLNKSKKFFTFDESHTWYYNGRMIRMGEIPPLPISMQPQLPENDKEFPVDIYARKIGCKIAIRTNLPDGSSFYIRNDINKFSDKYTVNGGIITINKARKIKKIVIDSNVFADDEITKNVFGNKCRNLVGKSIKYNPIYGNRLNCVFEF